MSSLQPRAPYSEEELNRLYPKGLKLQLVQVLLRHGERSPVTARFQNAGLPAYWPYCNAAKKLSSIALSNPKAGEWDYLQWRRRIETFAKDDGPLIATGPAGELDGICQAGELTDTGRETTLALGQRLRHLYVEQLKFMPKLISDADMIYLRATPMPRALESVQQAFWGLYPSMARTASFPPPTIITRTAADETLFPNESFCRRFAQLARAYAQRSADRWNDSEQMDYINKKIGKWMPEDSPKVAVDSHPRLSGVMDTINATIAHGKATRLPSEFYDTKLRDNIETIGVEEWFAGYQENLEYRQTGVGGLVGDIVGRMIGSIGRSGNDGLTEVADNVGSLGTGRGGEKSIKFALSGCHDTTLAAILSSLGCFKGEKWPPYTSHVAVELFRKSAVEPLSPDSHLSQATPVQTSKSSGLLSSIFGGSSKTADITPDATPPPVRKLVDQMSPAEAKALDGYYVRVRYNDRPVTVPGCKSPGSHLEGDESFCTLEAFKRITDKYTPKNWKQACNANLDQPAFPQEIEPAGY